MVEKFRKDQHVCQYIEVSKWIKVTSSFPQRHSMEAQMAKAINFDPHNFRSFQLFQCVIFSLECFQLFKISALNEIFG